MGEVRGQPGGQHPAQDVEVDPLAGKEAIGGGPVVLALARGDQGAGEGVATDGQEHRQGELDNAVRDPPLAGGATGGVGEEAKDPDEEGIGRRCASIGHGGDSGGGGRKTSTLWSSPPFLNSPHPNRQS